MNERTNRLFFDINREKENHKSNIVIPDRLTDDGKTSHRQSLRGVSLCEDQSALVRLKEVEETTFIIVPQTMEVMIGTKMRRNAKQHTGGDQRNRWIALTLAVPAQFASSSFGIRSRVERLRTEDHTQTWNGRKQIHMMITFLGLVQHQNDERKKKKHNICGCWCITSFGQRDAVVTSPADELGPNSRDVPRFLSFPGLFHSREAGTRKGKKTKKQKTMDSTEMQSRRRR